MANPNSADIQRVSTLLQQFRKLGPADHDKRDQVLDELQDAVGMAGKMVMEADIVRRAEKILAAPGR